MIYYSMSVMTSQITGNLTVSSTASLSWQQRKLQSSTLLALWESNPPLIRAFLSQRANDAENISMYTSLLAILQSASSNWPNKHNRPKLSKCLFIISQGRMSIMTAITIICFLSNVIWHTKNQIHGINSAIQDFIQLFRIWFNSWKLHQLCNMIKIKI